MIIYYKILSFIKLSVFLFLTFINYSVIDFLNNRHPDEILFLFVASLTLVLLQLYIYDKIEKRIDKVKA